MRLPKHSILLSGSGLLLSAVLLADTPRAPGIFNGIPPTTGPAVVDGQLTEDQTRSKIADIWNQQDQNGQPLPHALWVDRKGTVVAASPTTAPVDPLVSATLVSVHLSKVSTRKALSDFSKQTGVKLAIIDPQMWRGRSFPAITMDADNIPLLEAVNELACKAGLTPASTRNFGSPHPADPAHPSIPLAMQEQDRSMGPWEISGPFEFEVQQISHSMSLSEPGGYSQMQMQIEMQHEPRLVVLGKDQTLSVDEAVDEKGNNLSSENGAPAQHRHRGMWGSLFSGKSKPVDPPIYWAGLDQPLWVNLQPPANPGKSIARFRARARFLLQTKSETLETAATDKEAVEKTIAGIKCKVGPVTMVSPQQINCSIQFKRDTMDPSAWNQLASALQSVTPRIVDDNGAIIPNMQHMGGSTQGDVVEANFYWWIQGQGDEQSVPHPAKLLVDIPTQTRIVEVPVQFDNLPLP